MREFRIVLAGVLLVGGGIAIGAAVTDSGGDEPEWGEEAEVVVALESGESRAYTLAEAAAHIEHLEYATRRRRERSRDRDRDEDDGDDGAVHAAVGAEVPPPPLRHPDGRRFTPAELIELARSSPDVAQRRRATQALRWANTDAARSALEEILTDPETPAEVKVAAAHSLARPPNRDHLPEELIELLKSETDPEVRAQLARGVASLQVRGQWMSEISALLSEEADPAIREPLLNAVARASRDPAAREELVGIALDGTASLAERQRAIAALTRTRGDADLIAAVGPLLGAADPGLRRDAARILLSDRRVNAATFGKALGDSDAGVREAALRYGVRNLNQLARSKNPAVKAQYGRAVNLVIRAATSDPDAAVRRAGIQQVSRLPKKQRAAVLEAGRSDSDLHVRLTAYAGSPEPIRRKATGDFLGGLESGDAGLRNFSYNQLKRLYGIKVPYNGSWNAAARARAALEIRSGISAGQ